MEAVGSGVPPAGSPVAGLTARLEQSGLWDEGRRRPRPPGLRKQLRLRLLEAQGFFTLAWLGVAAASPSCLPGD